MPIDVEKQLTMNPVVTGNVNEIRPDLPDGYWLGTFKCDNKATSEEKGAVPMLVVQITTTETFTEGCEETVGAGCRFNVIFWPANHANARMTNRTIRSMRELYPDLPECDTSSLESGSWESLVPFVEALESRIRPFRTYVNKKGETEVSFIPGKGEEWPEGAGVGSEGAPAPAAAKPKANGANGHVSTSKAAPAKAPAKKSKGRN